MRKHTRTKSLCSISEKTICEAPMRDWRIEDKYILIYNLTRIETKTIRTMVHSRMKKEKISELEAVTKIWREIRKERLGV